MNPYGWIPYVIYPNLARPHEFWGASDLEDLIDVCRELNRRMTTISRILEVAGYPITVLENVTGSEGIRAEAGAVWELPEASRAYLLDMLQGGGVKHLGILKPWAPTLSFGMVILTDGNFLPYESYQSRADGITHGITSAIVQDGALYAVSKGDDVVVRLALGS